MQLKKISDLIPYEFNNRNHNEQQVDRIANSIKEFGFNQPIVIDESNIILVGHGRHLAALKLGLKEVPVLIKKDLSETQKKAYRILDNKLQNDSTWSFDNLELELGFLEDNGFELEPWGLDELRGLFDQEEPEVEDDEFDESECENDETFIKLGDLIELGAHRVMCGDSASNIDFFSSCDCVITDPPYGISVVKDNKVGADFGVAKKGKYAPIEGDDAIPDIRFLLDVGSKQLIFGGNYFSDQLPPSGSWLIWDKRGDTGIVNTFADCELAWSNCGGPARIYRQLWNGMIREGEKDKRVHPTQKPIKLISHCIQLAEGDVVADPFLGSGATLIAADQLNRICYGMEISPKYCHVIIERYKQHCEKVGKPFECKINGEPFNGTSN